jgi:hypothetical protein
MSATTNSDRLPSQAEFVSLSIPNLKVWPIPDSAACRVECCLKSGNNPVETPCSQEFTIRNISAGPSSSTLIAVEATAALRVTGCAVHEIHQFPSSREINQEPERLLRRMAPPKRFFRTLWRSMARRVHEREFKALL